MERRLFLTGLLGMAGAAALSQVAGPGQALAGVPNIGDGILDELGASEPDLPEDDAAAEPVRHRRHGGRRFHRRHHLRPHRHGRRRPHRRRVWRRMCDRYRAHGHWHRRCRRRRVWVWFYF